MKRIAIKLYILYFKIKDFLKVTFAALQLNVCKFQAIMYHEADGKKYYVIRTDANRYKIWNNEDIKAYTMSMPKRERNLNYYTLIKNACYQTKSK
jgi:hypothetical protein